MNLKEVCGVYMNPKEVCGVYTPVLIINLSLNNGALPGIATFNV